MEPLTAAERARLKSTGELADRVSDALSTGNHRADLGQFQRAVLPDLRKHLVAAGLLSAEEVAAAAPPPGRVGMPTTGTVNVFALLIDFPDEVAGNTAATIQTQLFGSPTTGAPYESLSVYYQRASYNRLTVVGTTYGWYRSSNNRSAIAQTVAGREGLIKEALNHFNSQGVNFAQFDNDGDGVVDYFLVFWAGPDTGWASFWWGKQLSFTDSTFLLDGVGFRTYSWQWEANPVGAAFSNRVAIHETGHALGLPDLYDYDDTVGPDGGVGGFDMMDKNKYDHNCFHKWLLDWTSPTVISSGKHRIKLRPSGTTGDCVAICPGLDTGEIFTEFFMVQNRRRVGNDTSIPTDGLIVWHIDATLSSNQKDFAFNNSNSAHKLIRLMEADGLEEIESSGSADAGDFYGTGETLGPQSTPSSQTYTTLQSVVSVYDITVVGDDIEATFEVHPIDVPGETVANFIVLNNHQLKAVTKTSPLSFAFDLPDNLDTGGSAVVMCKLLLNSAASIDLRCNLNGKWVLSNNLQGTDWSSMHFTFGAGTLKKSGNKLEFGFMDGAGSMAMSDVVVWYRTK